ncbi:hypothetical protein ABT237_17160 [Streptomyces sp. NPDC001581]
MITLSRLTQDIAPAAEDAPQAVKPWLTAAGAVGRQRGRVPHARAQLLP